MHEGGGERGEVIGVILSRELGYRELCWRGIFFMTVRPGLGMRFSEMFCMMVCIRVWIFVQNASVCDELGSSVFYIKTGGINLCQRQILWGTYSRSLFERHVRLKC